MTEQNNKVGPFFSIKQSLEVLGLPFDLKIAQDLGKVCSQLSRGRKLQTSKRWEGQYNVNTYLGDIVNEVFLAHPYTSKAVVEMKAKANTLDKAQDNKLSGTKADTVIIDDFKPGTYSTANTKLHIPALDKIIDVTATPETFYEGFLWRANDGRQIKPTDMDSSHLFNTVKMIWNHTVPAPLALLPYTEHTFGEYYTCAYMFDAIHFMVPELMRRYEELTPIQQNSIVHMIDSCKKSGFALAKTPMPRCSGKRGDSLDRICAI